MSAPGTRSTVPAGTSGTPSTSSTCLVAALGLHLSATYNSLAAAQDSPLGYGWSFSYGSHLSVDAAGEATVVEEDGSLAPFTATASGFTAPTWLPATLTHDADGTYTFSRRRDGTSWVYSSTGALQSVSDRNGYTTTLTYTGSGQLSTVTDPAGRSLTFTYGANGLISAVSDPAVRTVGFSYDSTGQLSSLTDVAGGVSSFGYDGAHHMSSETDPRSQTTTNTYDSTGRVLTQTDPRGNLIQLAYNGGTTTVTDRDGNVTTTQFSNLEPVVQTRGDGTAAAAS